MLFEGAQGAMLDIDHGTYPFVTSSNPVAGAACVGAGVGPRDIDEVWGIAKAYTTRVGAGPFPTELDDELGDEIRERGGEFGTTTGRAAPHRLARPRRAALRRAPERADRRSSITKLDVLSGFGPLKVCTRYRGAGRGRRSTPSPTTSPCCTTRSASTTELPGWSEDISEARMEADLPEAARDYLDFVAESVGVPIVLVGVGPGREQIVWTRTPEPADALAAA